jgi:hypothetical protein
VRRPAALAVAALGLWAGVPRAAPLAEAGGAEEREYAERARRVRREDAADLERLVLWADPNGLERTADPDWEALYALDPSDERARKRLHYVRRDGRAVRDTASWALVRAVPDERPERVPAYEARRRRDYERPAAARHRDLAAWCRDRGLAAAAEDELRAAVDADPDDYWSRFALGEVPDPDDGWVSAPVRARRTTEARAAAAVRRLRAIRSDPVRVDGASAYAGAVDAPLSRWRLREWELTTDLPDEAAAHALATVDLGARWFREFFGVPAGERVLPGDGTFVVLSTDARYRQVIDAHPALSSGSRAFARNLGAFPLPHSATRGPWEVVIERPDGPFAADACLHYAVHFLMQARFGVEAQEAWLYEGLAAYAVARILGVHGSWCVRLEPTVSKYGHLGIPDPAEWPALVHGLVAKHEDFPMRGLIGLAPNGLDGDMLVKAWSILRLLLEDRPDEARLFLAAKRMGWSTPTAIRVATGLPLEAFEEAWRGYVLSIGPE